ncbi:MAG: hypothetical protein K6T65_03830 [Peptococcaceae bacterium]|nr:hypothetical protein [Peptococcaceae bacterium]
MKSRPTLIVLVLIFIASVVPSATMACWIKLSPQELIEKSDVVLIGDIVGQVDEDEGKRVTYWNVKVYYYLKGDRKSGEFIVGTPGVKTNQKLYQRITDWINGETRFYFFCAKKRIITSP